MRILIDFNVDRNEIALVCEVTDNSCVESCINFLTTEADSVTVYLERNGETIKTVLPVAHCSACYVLDDAAMRTAGGFTIYAAGKTRLRFVVGETIPAGVEYSISLTNGVFYVSGPATSGGGESGFGMFAFHIDDNGHLICTYDGSNPPPLSIDENGHLIWTMEG